MSKLRGNGSDSGRRILLSFSLTLRIALIWFLEIEQQLEFESILMRRTCYLCMSMGVSSHPRNSSTTNWSAINNCSHCCCCLHHVISNSCYQCHHFSIANHTNAVPRASFHNQIDSTVFLLSTPNGLHMLPKNNNDFVSDWIDSVERNLFARWIAIFSSKTDWFFMMILILSVCNREKSMATLILIVFFYFIGKISLFFSSYQSNYSYE